MLIKISENTHINSDHIHAVHNNFDEKASIYKVVLVLLNGSGVQLGTYASQKEADEEARKIIDQVNK